MKKVLSLLLVVGMLCSMMISVNAINKDGNFAFASDVTEVTVGDTFVVKVMLIGDTDTEVGLNSANVKVSATENASFDSAEPGAAAENYSGTNNFNKSTGVLQVMDADASVWAYGDGEYAILTFTALEAGTFTITNTSMNAKFAKAGTTEKNTIRTAIAPLSITIKDAAPADTTVYGDATACAKVWEAKKDAESAYTHTFQNVAVATATCPATATAAGFKFAKDSETASETAEKWAVDFDATIVNGDGAVEYTTVMFGVNYSEVETVYAIPYYVPAN